jgi:drug/metabolite transporter (DMT)-like permease
VGACILASSAVLVKLADVSPSTAAVFRCAYALPVLAVLALRERRRLGAGRASERGLALAAGMVFAIDLLVWHRAIGDIGAGLATVLGNLQVAVVPLVAWALFGDRPTRRMALAIALAAVGVVLLAGVLEQGAYGRDPHRGVILGVVSGVAYSGFLMLFRAGNRDTRRSAGPLFDITVAAMAVSLVAGAAVGDLDLRPSWPAHGWLIVLALSTQVIGWLLIAATIARLSSAVSSVLLTVQPVAAVLLGNLIFGEAPSMLQLLGVVALIATLTIVVRGAGASPPDPRGDAGGPPGPDGQPDRKRSWRGGRRLRAELEDL